MPPSVESLDLTVAFVIIFFESGTFVKILKMAAITSDATAERCQLNASLSASIVDDKSQLMQFYREWSEKYDEVL